MNDARESSGKAKRAIISAGSKPLLPRHVRLWHDRTRGRWTILAPERIFRLDVIAVTILQLCDGIRTVDEIAQELAGSYSSPKERILADIKAMLQDLADKGVVKVSAPHDGS